MHITKLQILPEYSGTPSWLLPTGSFKYKTNMNKNILVSDSYVLRMDKIQTQPFAKTSSS
jgi:hypothetical protein